MSVSPFPVVIGEFYLPEGLIGEFYAHEHHDVFTMLLTRHSGRTILGVTLGCVLWRWPMIKAPSVEKYRILKASLGDGVFLDMTPGYIWVVRTRGVSILTPDGPRAYTPLYPARDPLEAIEHAFQVLALYPVTVDGGAHWSVFDAMTWAKTRGREVVWKDWVEPVKVTGEPDILSKQNVGN